jgi:hypothetical protein
MMYNQYRIPAGLPETKREACKESAPEAGAFQQGCLSLLIPFRGTEVTKGKVHNIFRKAFILLRWLLHLLPLHV